MFLTVLRIAWTKVRKAAINTKWFINPILRKVISHKRFHITVILPWITCPQAGHKVDTLLRHCKITIMPGLKWLYAFIKCYQKQYNKKYSFKTFKVTFPSYCDVYLSESASRTRKKCSTGLDFVHGESIGLLNDCGLLLLWFYDVSDRLSCPCASKHVIKKCKHFTFRDTTASKGKPKG